jgi:carboxypeptidase C (cathepsin A)
MLFIEQPVGVGFSYASGENAESIYGSNNDNNTAERNVLAVNEFFRLYPEYIANKFYITGESYAGIYVPTLAYDIITASKNTYTGAPLIGIAVGNGCTGYEAGICGWYYTDTCAGFKYEWQFFLDTAFADYDLRNAVNAACDWDICTNNVNTSVLSDLCLNLVQNVSNLVGYINTYNIYGECLHTSCQYSAASPSLLSSVSSLLSLQGTATEITPLVEPTLSGKAGPLRRPFRDFRSKAAQKRLRSASAQSDDDGYLEQFTNGTITDSA